MSFQNKPKTNTNHHNGDLNVGFCWFFLVRFTHFNWLTFKELI